MSKAKPQPKKRATVRPVQTIENAPQGDPQSPPMRKAPEGARPAQRPPQSPMQLPVRLIEQGRNQSHYLIDALTKAATTTGTQIEMVERLWTMHKEAEDRQAEREFGIAKVALAMELPTIPKNHKISFVDKNNQTRETPYADRVDIESVLDPICKRHGFSKEYSTETIDGKACQVLTVRHVSGHKEVYRSPYMPLDTTGSKNNNQAAGSTAEYGKRYALIGAFNVIGVDRDDDGNLGSDEPEKPSSDKFTNRVQQDAATAPAAKPAPSTVPKLTLPEAAEALEMKIRNTAKDKRGAMLMKYIFLIGEMEKDAELSAKAAELRKLCEDQPNGQ